jgi:phage-related tail fiber protein
VSRLVLNGLNLNARQITNLADGSAATDAVTKQQLDAAVRGLDWKASVRAATTVAGTLASSFENGDAIDGVTLATGDRILIKDQASGAENGIYVVAASGAPTRAVDADASAEVTSGLAVTVTEGTTNGDKTYVLTTNDPITLDTTALTFSLLGGASSPVTAGNGLTLSGSTLDVGAGPQVRGRRRRRLLHLDHGHPQPRHP